MNEHQYFQAIEAHFIGLRGAPLLLSPADWQVAKRWWEAGIPLDLVRRTLDEIFERRRESSGDGAIQTLRYCSRAVEGAWRAAAEHQQAGRREAPEPIDVTERLERLVQALPEEMPKRDAVAAEIRALEGTVREVETGLAEIDGRALVAAREALGQEARAEIEARVAEDLRAFGDRMDPEAVQSAYERLFEQRLRRRLELPVLSLFSDS